MIHNLTLKGERLRDEGMERAAESKERLITECMIAFIDALLTSPDGLATIDDATSDLASKFPDGGKWRGSVTRRLAAKRVIEPAGAVRSTRPSRHRGYVTQWQLRDRDLAVAIRSTLLGKLQ